MTIVIDQFYYAQQRMKRGLTVIIPVAIMSTTKQFLVFGSNSMPNDGSTNYSTLNGEGGFGTTQTNYRIPVAARVQFGSLFIRTNAAPGAGKTVTITVMQNATPTALSASINGAIAQHGSNTSVAINFDQTDEISIRIEQDPLVNCDIVAWGMIAEML